MSALKPCPFCGSEAFMDDGQVTCMAESCDFMVWTSPEHWNTRADESRIRREATSEILAEVVRSLLGKQVMGIFAGGPAMAIKSEDIGPLLRSLEAAEKEGAE